MTDILITARRRVGDIAARGPVGDTVGRASAMPELSHEAVLETDPTNPAALLGLAEQLLRRGDPARARLLLLRATRVAPGLAVAWAMLGIAMRVTGDPSEAETAFATAQRLEPRDYGHAMHRMEAARAAGRAEAELARLEAATSADPLDAVAMTARGALLDRLGRHREAADVLETAVLLAPDDRMPAVERANALMRGASAEAAEAALARAIELAPDQPLLASNRAVVLMRLHRHRESADALRAVMAETGPNPQSLCNLSTALTALGEQDEAVSAARRASAIAPDAHLPYRSLMNAIAYRHGVTGAAMLEIGRRAAATIPRDALGPLANDTNPGRRIRVGLLSQALKSHPVGWLTIAAFENLDPERFEIVCIGQTPTGDPIERRFQAIASSWHEAEAMQTPSFAGAIRALGIDVLIELSGYGDRGMMSVCASRVAPVQVKWVGMQNHSTALPEMDWFITDRWETPERLRRLYTERLMLMPDGYVVYSPPSYAPDVAMTPAARTGAVTFGSFNNIAKVTPHVIRVWADILQRVNRSRMILKTHQMDDPASEMRLRDAFRKAGVADDRLELRGRSPHRVLLRQYNDIDIVLDPFPYVGGLTTCEALWMGVPTITLAGEIFASRHAASHLSNVGLSDWVAHDIESYRDMAVRRASDIPALAALRAGMRARVKASPLCDGPRFGRHLGNALRGAWEAWCADAD
jgi:predicted O-linked N-acetylglucosamine transferase (SPINDLY family)